MYLKPSSNLVFVNNQALSVGDAVYTDFALELPRLTLPCSFQDKNNINTAAGVAGNSLYGGYTDGCKGFYRLETGSIALYSGRFSITTHQITQRYLQIRLVSVSVTQILH